jgi:hypothetical protein
MFNPPALGRRHIGILHRRAMVRDFVVKDLSGVNELERQVQSIDPPCLC